MLEPLRRDPFNRQSERPPAVYDEEYPEEENRYEVERIMDKRVVRIGCSRRPYTQHFVIWKGYPIHEGEWVREDDLDAPDLVEDYERSVREFSPVDDVD